MHFWETLGRLVGLLVACILPVVIANQHVASLIGGMAPGDPIIHIRTVRCMYIYFMNLHL